MESALSLASIAFALSLGAISPGPSFILVARTAVAASRTDAVATAVGMGVGAAAFALAALLGLNAVFAAAPWAYTGGKIVGGLYLIYLAFRIWQGARQPLVVPESQSTDVLRNETPLRAFALGLGTQLSNPKTAVVFSSVFAALLPQHPPMAFYVLLPLIAFTIDVSWYTVVAYALSSPSSRSAYLRHKAWVDRAAASVMGLLGVRLLTMTK